MPWIKPKSCFPLVLCLFPRKDQDCLQGQWRLPTHQNSSCGACCVLPHFPIPATVSPFLPFLLLLWAHGPGSTAEGLLQSLHTSVTSSITSYLLICVLGSRFGMRFGFPLRRETTAKGKANNSFLDTKRKNTKGRNCAGWCINRDP